MERVSIIPYAINCLRHASQTLKYTHLAKDTLAEVDADLREVFIALKLLQPTQKNQTKKTNKNKRTKNA